jgi:siroheme synthase-like protein
MANTYLPITLSVKQRPTLVIGGGNVAMRKVETLLDYETPITVVAPEVDKKIEFHAEHGRLTLEKRPYRPGEAATYGLVIAASDDRELNRRVSEDCRASGVLVNVVDDPAYCDFIFPAIVRRDCLTAAIATDGKAPFVSGHLRAILTSIFPDHWTKLMRYAAAFRKDVQKRWGSDLAKKEACYSRFLEADWKSLLKQNDQEAIEAELAQMLGE